MPHFHYTISTTTSSTGLFLMMKAYRQGCPTFHAPALNLLHVGGAYLLKSLTTSQSRHNILSLLDVVVPSMIAGKNPRGQYTTTATTAWWAPLLYIDRSIPILWIDVVVPHHQNTYYCSAHWSIPIVSINLDLPTVCLELLI